MTRHLLNAKPELTQFGSKFLPGQSWHQYGEAVDLFTVVAGKAVWDGSTAERLHRLSETVGVFASAKQLSWTTRSKKWHFQQRAEETPLSLRGFADSWRDVERMMNERFF
jgi:hypothetical protein